MRNFNIEAKAAESLTKWEFCKKILNDQTRVGFHENGTEI